MKRPGAVGLVCLAGLLPPAAVGAQPGRGAVETGNRLYAEGRFEEAHEQYLEALRAAPDSPIAPFNNGAALYRTDEFQRATEAFRQAAESGDPAVEARAWYNLGNALYRQQQLEPALEAYKQALRRDPTDGDAKHNLELTLEQLREQPRQQQPSDGRQDDGENDESENQDQQPGQQEQDRQQQDQQQGQDQPQEQDRQEQDQQQQGQEQQQEQDRQQGQDRQQTEEQGQDRQQQEEQGQDRQQQEPSGDEPPAEPGELTREDAERLLEAIDEDPDRIQRRRRTAAPARPPRRPW